MLAFLVSALGIGLGKALEKLLDKGVIEPALDKGLEPLRKWLTRGYDQKKDESRLREAIGAALKAATGTDGMEQWTKYRWVVALDEIQAKPELAARVAAATIEMVKEDAENVPPDLLAELKITDQRQPFARFLFALRAQLVSLPGIGDGIRYANEMHKLDRLNGLYELVAAAASADYAGTAIWVRAAPPDARQLEQPYLETLVADLNRLSLEGRALEEGQAGRTDEPIRLDQVYIALNTRETRVRQTREGELQRRDRGAPAGVVLEPRLLSALRAVSEERHLVLLGDPGSGKTTLARHLCVCLAGARSEGERWSKLLTAGDLERWPLTPYFPVFVRLREFAADVEALPVDREVRGQAQHLLGFIKDGLIRQGWEPLAGRLQTLLEQGEALVVFDGLDEVTHPRRAETPENMPGADDARRERVAQAILDFAQIRFRRARILVTCRVRQYISESGQRFKWRLPGFPFFTLANFDEAQVRAFVTSWFGAQAGRIAKPDEKRDTLLAALANRSELADLAPIPIILTQMALIHAARELPGSRVAVYHACADILLWDWERLKHLQSGRQGQSADDFLKGLGIPGLRRDDVEMVLYAAVFEAHQLGEPEIPEALLLRHLTDRFMAYNLARSKAIGPAQQIIDEWLRGRNGLLLPASGQSFDLPHRSFREFMAGRVLAERGYRTQAGAEEEPWDEAGPRLVAEDMTKWREVFRFAAALSARRIRDVVNALESLWPDDAAVSAAAAPRLLLAADVVRDVGPANLKDRTSPRRYTDLYDKIEQALINLARDSEGGPYPADIPRHPPTPSADLPPRTRLEAGWLLSDLDWTPPDLDDLVLVESPAGGRFWIGKYPITNLQYARFLASAEYREETVWRSLTIFDHKEQQRLSIGEQAWKWFQEAGGPERRPSYWAEARFGEARRLFPVVGVTWYEAAAYGAWFSRHWREYVPDRSIPEAVEFRLPRESEWVAAAGGAEGDRYPWQATPQAVAAEAIPAYANTGEADLNGTTPVCLYPAGMSLAGVMDMAGNVWEWQANWHDKDDDWVALRGGAWSAHHDIARVAARSLTHLLDDWIDNGFRVAGAVPVSQ